MSDAKTEIDLDDLLAFPVWRYDSEAEVFLPLTDIDSPIGSIDELHFYATFISRSGHTFQGSVTGKGETAMGIFCNGRWYSLSKDWKQASVDQLRALVSDSKLQNVHAPSDLIPFSFETVIKSSPFVDWVGEFDLE
jgi:hypothetical protein